MSIKGAAVFAISISSVLSSENGNSTSEGRNLAGTTGARTGSSLHGNSNVNVLLGGAMLSGVILVVFLICYCCHRNMRKSGRGSQYWQEEPEVPLEVFTVDGQISITEEEAHELQHQQHCLEAHQHRRLTIHEYQERDQRLRRQQSPLLECYEVAGVFLTTDSCASFDTLTCPQRTSPPPPYDTVVADKKGDNNVQEEAKVQPERQFEDSTGLPSYEAALRLEAQGYV